MIVLIAALFGSQLGGWLTDRLGRSNKAWLGWVPGYGFILAFPLFLGSYMAQSLTFLLLFLALGMFVMMMAAPPIFSCLHAVCGTARRATAIAIAYFFANLLGVGLGPVITGLLSDSFAASMGEAEGLRYALMVMTALYLPSAFFMLRASRTLEQDAED
jgi:MFS family permease